MAQDTQHSCESREGSSCQAPSKGGNLPDAPAKPPRLTFRKRSRLPGVTLAIAGDYQTSKPEVRLVMTRGYAQNAPTETRQKIRLNNLMLLSPKITGRVDFSQDNCSKERLSCPLSIAPAVPVLRRFGRSFTTAGPTSRPATKSATSPSMVHSATAPSMVHDATTPRRHDATTPRRHSRRASVPPLR